MIAIPFFFIAVEFIPVQILFAALGGFVETRNAVFDGQEVVDTLGAQSRLVQLGRAYNFDGVNDFIDLPNVVNINSADKIKVSFTFATNQTSTAVPFTIRETSGDVSEIKLQLSISAAGIIRLRSGSSTGGLILHDTANSYNDGQHYALSVEIDYVSKDWSFSIDGVELASGNETDIKDGSDFAQGVARIGRSQGTGSPYNGFFYAFNLELDDASTNNYKCDEVGGTIAYDSSGNGNDATITNATLGTFHATLADGNGADFQNQVGYTPAMYFTGASNPRNFVDVDLAAGNNFDDNDFSIEALIRFDNNGGLHDRIMSTGADGVAGTWQLAVHATNRTINLWNGPAGTIWLTSTTTINDTDTYHVRVDRSGTTTRLFVNGTEEDSTTTNLNFNSTNTINIGSYYINNAIGNGTRGEIKAVMISDVSRGTANFTAPTKYSDYTVDENTLLFLLHGNWDESPYQNTITENGNQNICIPRDEATPAEDATGGDLFFEGRVKYNAQLVNSTALDFDGVNDHVRLNDSTDYDLTGEFTFDCWFLAQSFNLNAPARRIVSSGLATAIGALNVFVVPTTNNVAMQALDGTGGSLLVSNGNLNDGLFHHIAITRDSSDVIRLFVDGIFQDDATDTTTIGVWNSFAIGQYRTTGGGNFDGQIHSVRITNGTALWTDNFIPPKRYDTLDANTVLFLPLQEGNGNRAFDESGNQNHGTLTNFTLPAAWTNETQDVVHRNLLQGFDETGLYNGVSTTRLQAEHNTNLDFGSDNFTIDAWVYSRTTAANVVQPIISSRENVSGTPTTDRWGFRVWNDGSGNPRLNVFLQGGGGSPNINTTTTDTFTSNEWHHVALVRDGTTIRFFIDGVASQTVAIGSTDEVNGTDNLFIGIVATVISTQAFNGYIANTRIFNGRAVWTAGFTPPRTTADYSDTTDLVMFNRGDRDTTGNFTFTNTNVIFPRTRIADTATTSIDPEHVASTWHNGAETEFRNYQAPELINNDVADYMFTAGTPNDISFADMIASRGSGLITTDIVDADLQKENHTVNTPS